MYTINDKSNFKYPVMLTDEQRSQFYNANQSGAGLKPSQYLKEGQYFAYGSKPGGGPVDMTTPVYSSDNPVQSQEITPSPYGGAPAQQGTGLRPRDANGMLLPTIQVPTVNGPVNVALTARESFIQKNPYAVSPGERAKFDARLAGISSEAYKARELQSKEAIARSTADAIIGKAAVAPTIRGQYGLAIEGAKGSQKMDLQSAKDTAAMEREQVRAAVAEKRITATSQIEMDKLAQDKFEFVAGGGDINSDEWVKKRTAEQRDAISRLEKTGDIEAASMAKRMAFLEGKAIFDAAGSDVNAQRRGEAMMNSATTSKPAEPTPPVTATAAPTTNDANNNKVDDRDDAMLVELYKIKDAYPLRYAAGIKKLQTKYPNIKI